MASIFTRIINGEIPGFFVAEEEQFVAILDAFPLVEGHTLIIPRREVDDYFDLTEAELAALNVFARKVARAVKKAFGCTKVAVSVIGLEVPHAHLHLVPIDKMSDCDFTRDKLTVAPERMAEIRDRIKACME